jgi:hypothetical protein
MLGGGKLAVLCTFGKEGASAYALLLFLPAGKKNPEFVHGGDGEGLGGSLLGSSSQSCFENFVFQSLVPPNVPDLTHRI